MRIDLGLFVKAKEFINITIRNTKSRFFYL